MNPDITGNYKLAWYRSWIMRLAFLCLLFLLVGFLLNLYFSIKGFESVTNIAFSKQLEASIDKQLVEYKNLRIRQKKLITDTIKNSLNKRVVKTRTDLHKVLSDTQILNFFVRFLTFPPLISISLSSFLYNYYLFPLYEKLEIAPYKIQERS